MPEAALGLAAGTALSVIKHRMATAALARAEGLPPERAQRLLMRRMYVRFALSCAAIVAAVGVGVAFAVGLALGVTLEVFVYMCVGLREALRRS